MSLLGYIFSHLWESSRGVGLVGFDDLSVSELLVGVSGPDDLAGLVIDNGEGGEAIALTKLAAPARGDGISTA